MNKNHLKALAFIVLLFASALACTSTNIVEVTPTGLPTVIPSTVTPTVPPTTAPPTEAPPTTAPPTDVPPTETPPDNTGQVLFSDDFSDPESGWDVFSGDIGSAAYNNGKYELTLFTSLQFVWANPYQNFTDVVVEVTADKTTTEDDVQYGIICRHQDINNWYALVISGDGFAAIRKRYQGSENLITIGEWVDAPAVNRGAAVNELRAECVGDRLALYANGTLVIETHDSDIPSGDIGLIAGTFENAQFLVVTFDDLTVTSP